MLILEDLSVEVPDTNAHHWHLKDFSEESNESVLMYGFNITANSALKGQCQDFKRKIYFNNWAPCEFAQTTVHNNKNAVEYDEYFNEIYSICPYSCDWLNSLNLGRTYKSIFYPFNTEIIPEVGEKEYDVIYHGGIHGQDHVLCLLTMRDFNYRYITMTNHINDLTRQCLPFATDTNLRFDEKLSLVAKSKISVCYNLVHLSDQHIPAIKMYPDWKKNQAFNEIEKWRLLPQFKTRAHEAAISKTLNLVQRDPWNIMERYYEPEKEFIYFNNEVDLKKKIHEIINDWEAYEEIIENAYKKAMNYTTFNFIERIKNDT